MPFYEIIYETGSKSVIQADDDEQALSGVYAHHKRAIAGEPGRGKSEPRSDLGDQAPQVLDYPAEQVVKVIKYDVHPADLNADGTMSRDVLKTELDTLLKDSPAVVDVQEFAARLRELLSPVVESERHESMYKMDGTELTLDLEGGE
jgi:hypothetical protein